MLTLFTDITGIKGHFMSDAISMGAVVNGGQLSEKDFVNWVWASIDFLQVIFVDFQISSECAEFKFNTAACDDNVNAVTNFTAIGDLYAQLKECFDFPELMDKEVASCIGFIEGDLLGFHMEFLDE